MNSQRRVGWVAWVALLGALLAQEAGAFPIGAEWVGRQLTDVGWQASYPMFSPDGARITYIGRPYGGNHDDDRVYVANSDGTNHLQITSRVSDMPSFSQDGQFIYTQGPGTDGPGDIWRTSVDGLSDSRHWTTLGFGDQTPNELPDGRIVYQRTNPLDIYVAVSASDQTALTSAGNRQMPRVSSSGRYITYHSGDSGGTPFDIFVYDLILGTERQLTSDAANQGYPSFSPDEQWIIYQSMEGGGSHWDVWVMDAATGTQRYQLTNFANMDSRHPQFDPAFPDGSRIVFSSVVDGSNRVDLWELTVAVPEPCTLALLGVGVAALLRRRRRQL